MKNRDLVVIASSAIVCFSTHAAAVGFALEHQSAATWGMRSRAARLAEWRKSMEHITVTKQRIG